jgi:hypothetical protein
LGVAADRVEVSVEVFDRLGGAAGLVEGDCDGDGVFGGSDNLTARIKLHHRLGIVARRDNGNGGAGEAREIVGAAEILQPLVARQD